MADKPKDDKPGVPANPVPNPAKKGGEVPAGKPTDKTPGPMNAGEPTGTHERPAEEAGSASGRYDPLQASGADHPLTAGQDKPDPFAAGATAGGAKQAGPLSGTKVGPATVDPGRQGRSPTPISPTVGENRDEYADADFPGEVREFMAAVRGIDADGAAESAGKILCMARRANPQSFTTMGASQPAGFDPAESARKMSDQMTNDFERFAAEETGRTQRFSNPHYNRVGVAAGSPIGLASHANTPAAGSLAPNDIAMLIDLVRRAIGWWRGRSGV